MWVGVLLQAQALYHYQLASMHLSVNDCICLVIVSWISTYKLTLYTMNTLWIQWTTYSTVCISKLQALQQEGKLDKLALLSYHIYINYMTVLYEFTRPLNTCTLNLLHHKQGSGILDWHSCREGCHSAKDSKRVVITLQEEEVTYWLCTYVS